MTKNGPLAVRNCDLSGQSVGGYKGIPTHALKVDLFAVHVAGQQEYALQCMWGPVCCLRKCVTALPPVRPCKTAGGADIAC